MGWARLITYVELGKHREVYKDRKTGKETPKEVNKVLLQWELSGKLFPPSNEETGREKPFVISEILTLSTNEKATFYKLFKRLNWEGTATHMVQLLGKPFKVKVTHNVKGERTYTNLKEDGVYNIEPPFLITETEEGQTKKAVKVADAISPFRAFIWDLADKEQWDSIFIDGKYEDRTDDKGVTTPGRSKNWIQERIQAALNFKGSPASAFVSGEAELDLDTDPLDKADNKPKQEPKESFDLNDDIPF